MFFEKDIKRGDVAVFVPPTPNLKYPPFFVKRVIGIPNSKIVQHGNKKVCIIKEDGRTRRAGCLFIKS